MASFPSSSSSMYKSCAYCSSHSDVLRAGWPLRNGGRAMLCDQCASAYEEGSFCNKFHLHDSGWRNCITCKTDVHCGCIMSFHLFIELDCGGVQCTQCVGYDVPLEPPMSSNSRKTLEDWQGPSEIFPYVVSTHMNNAVTGNAQGVPSQEDAPPSKKGEHSCTDLVEVPEDNEESQSDVPGINHSLGRCTLVPGNEDLNRINRDLNSVVIPLFEKILTRSDANPKNGRFVLPKRCVEVCLPKPRPEGSVLQFQDNNGRYWDFDYCFWSIGRSGMYVLKGITSYLLHHQCKPGDKVSLYRIDPEGKLLIELTRAMQNQVQNDVPK